MHQISDICAAAYFLTIWAVRWENAVSYLGLQLVLTVLYMMYFTGTHQSWLSYYYMVQITNNIVLYTTSFLSRKKNLYYIIMNWKCEFSHDGKKSEVSGLALENHFWLKTNSFILTLQTMTKCITFAKLIKLKYAIRERHRYLGYFPDSNSWLNGSRTDCIMTAFFRRYYHHCFNHTHRARWELCAQEI